MSSSIIYARTLLFEQSEGAADIVLVNDQMAEAVLPVLYGQPVFYRFSFPKRHPKDTRTFIVFDGDFPCGSLSRDCQIIHTQELGYVGVPLDNIYRKKAGESDGPYYDEAGEIGVQMLYRHFILSRSTQFVGRRCKDNLAPRYVMIQVEEGKVRFLASKY